MSVLLNLPNELCFYIMSNWINYEPEIYMTLLLIDTTVKYNADLRLLLLNHFNFCKSFEKNFISRIDFNWEEGYSCDVIEDCTYRWKYHLQVEGIHPIARRIIYRCMEYKNIQEAIQFINNCKGVKEVEFWSDQILIGLSEDIMLGLTSMEIGRNTPIKYHSGFEHIKLHCRHLTKFLVFGYKTDTWDTLLSTVMNGIVLNNPNLQSIGILTNNDIFYILINNDGNYTNLQTIQLHIREKVIVANIFKIINKYPNVTKFAINSDDFRCNWRVDIDIDSATRNENVEWIFYNLDDNLLCDVAEYARTTTTSIRIFSVKSLNNFSLKSFQKLNKLDIICSLVGINRMETVHRLPLTLNNLIICRISVIIAVLKCCRSLFQCRFYFAIDDSQQNPTVVTQLRTTLSEYPDCLIKFEALFNSADGYIKYVNGKLTACETMKHYVNTEKCIEDHGYWTETLKHSRYADV